jgi:hypothetical protein
MLFSTVYVPMGGRIMFLSVIAEQEPHQLGGIGAGLCYAPFNWCTVVHGWGGGRFLCCFGSSLTYFYFFIYLTSNCNTKLERLKNFGSRCSKMLQLHRLRDTGVQYRYDTGVPYRYLTLPVCVFENCNQTIALFLHYRDSMIESKYRYEPFRWNSQYRYW